MMNNLLIIFCLEKIDLLGLHFLYFIEYLDFSYLYMKYNKCVNICFDRYRM